MPARTTLAVLLLLLGALAGCAPGASGPLADEDAVEVDRVEMHDNEFAPAVIEVAEGTTVTWEFTDDGRRHDVVGDGFESEAMSEGTFMHTFAEPGTYDYRCSLHGGMSGRVIVTG